VTGKAIDSDARKSRSDFRRGPGKARSSPVESDPETVPFGGYGLLEAGRHMAGIAPDCGIDHGDPTYFALTRAIVVAARRWRRVANDRIRHLEQNMSRLEILYLVGYSGKDLNQSQLARLISVKGSTMVHMLNALAQEGLIERHQNPADRRVTLNRITEPGRATVRNIMQELTVLRDEIYGQFDQKQLQDTLTTMDALLVRLERMID
jgi:MarR family transcriptional regulator, transcriptional regulator for hemolysin